MREVIRVGHATFMKHGHIDKCVAELYEAFKKAYGEIRLKDLTKNKIDTIAMEAMLAFADLRPEDYLRFERLRQAEKSFMNAIGEFHEQLLCGVHGIEKDTEWGCDIRKEDRTLFAEVKNKFNTMNSSGVQTVFNKLRKTAEENNADCYLVIVIAKNSFCERWQPSGDPSTRGGINYHERVYVCSADQFYRILTKDEQAFRKLRKDLSEAMQRFALSSTSRTFQDPASSVIQELTRMSTSTNKSILELLDEMTFRGYLGYPL
ncbi:MAG: Eco47II family restriction endonuclease [Coriobacteriia bacterium]|nr:Eco47II family restriction endonuclease [Coriobacteriia bacterium]